MRGPMNECPPDFLALEIITYQFNFVVHIYILYISAECTSLPKIEEQQIISIQFFRLLSKILQFLFISKSTKVINKLLGALLGFFKGIIFISIFVWFFELIPNHKISKIIISPYFFKEIDSAPCSVYGIIE